MDEKKLMVFLQKILENGSSEKACNTLNQLKEILRGQNYSAVLMHLDLIDAAIEALPEVQEAARTKIIDKEDIAIAKERKYARIAREMSCRGCR